MSDYKTYSPEQIDNHLSQFLVNSWSYSKVSTFSRNQKAFEMEYVYGYRAKSSATTVAGQAYHKALEYYFAAIKNNQPVPDLVTMTQLAFDYISEVDARNWKLQKTCKSVGECISKANETSNDLIVFFREDISVYMDDIEEILEVELYGEDFVIVNGVEIPIPLKFRLDLVVRTKSGKVVVIDHKSKGTYTSEADIKLAIGKQAVTYAIGYEAKTGVKVDEVWFMENKYSKNRDKTPQVVKFVIDISSVDERRYFEAMLYESLKAMILAVHDPDYVYLMNDSDNLVDLAEMYDFWNKTLIAEVEEFEIDPSKQELIKNRLKKIKDSGIKTINPNVIKQFRKNAAEFIQYDYSNTDMSEEEKIEHVLRGFGTVVKVAKKFDGYSSNTYLLDINAGVKISSIHQHKLDLANALNVNTVRISQNLAVYENKSYLAIEVAKKRERDLLFDKKDLVDMKIPIGKDNFGNVIFWDFNNHSTPHALICGGTGSGKSVEVRSIIEFSLLAGVEQIEILDLKNEFSNIKNSKKVSVFREIEEIEKRAEELVSLMNERIKSGTSKHTLVVVEEFADAYLMMSKGKSLDIMEEVQDGFYAPRKMKGLFGEYMSDPIPKMKMKAVGRRNSLEENIQSLLQKGRSSGFHLLMATQRADAKTINGSAKVNLPVQICFRVQKAVDSIVVLDEPGAESLAGGGDGLIKSPEYQEIKRFQAYYKP